MLERVRQWRAEAYEALLRESEAARRQRTHDWARRLNLPMIDHDECAGPRRSVPTEGDQRHP